MLDWRWRSRQNHHDSSSGDNKYRLNISSQLAHQSEKRTVSAARDLWIKSAKTKSVFWWCCDVARERGSCICCDSAGHVHEWGNVLMVLFTLVWVTLTDVFPPPRGCWICEIKRTSDLANPSRQDSSHLRLNTQALNQSAFWKELLAATSVFEMRRPACR